jgi:hypothetical protein
MSKNKPTNKKVNKPKAKKPNGRKTWLKVAKKVHQLNKKQKLGWTWSESMRFASKNVYPNFKGKTHNKIKLSDIELEFNDKIQQGKQPVPTPTPKPIENCFSALDVPAIDLIDREWFLIGDSDIWDVFDPNLPMRFVFDGIIDTGIIKKSLMPNMTEIRDKIRNLYSKEANKSEELPTIIFKILVQPNKKDDGKPCSYYVLVTFNNSSLDIETDKDEIFTKTKLEDLPEDKKQERILREEEKKKQKKEKEKRRKAEARLKPKEVEPKSVTQSKAKIEDTPKVPTDKNIDLEILKLQRDRQQSFERSMNDLRKDFEKGLITKRQFQQRQQQIIDKFEKGGKIY